MAGQPRGAGTLPRWRQSAPRQGHGAARRPQHPRARRAGPRMKPDGHDALRPTPELQDARVEALLCRPTDADHGGVCELMLEDGHHQAGGRPPRALPWHPRAVPSAARAAAGARTQGAAAHPATIPVPPFLAVQQRHEVIQTDPLERAADGSAIETIRLGGIAHRGVQTAERQVRSLRHEHHIVPWRQVDGAAAPWPQARHRPNSLLLSDAVSPTIKTRSPAVISMRA